jgi:uncharacterized protein
MAYEIKSTSNSKFTFNLKAGNNEVVLTSQSYASQKNAEEGIASVQRFGTKAENFELLTSTAGEPYFVLKASNGQVIGKSEMYKSEAAAKNGMASVIKNAAAKEVQIKQTA